MAIRNRCHRPDRDDGLEPHERLAVAVVRKAIADTRNPSRIIREDAERFVGGDWRMRTWCSVAGVDPERMLRALEGAGGGAGRPEAAVHLRRRTQADKEASP